MNTLGYSSRVSREPFQICLGYGYIFMDPATEGLLYFLYVLVSCKNIYSSFSVHFEISCGIKHRVSVLIPEGIVPVCRRFAARCPSFSLDHHKHLFGLCLSTCRRMTLSYHDLPMGKMAAASCHLSNLRLQATLKR